MGSYTLFGLPLYPCCPVELSEYGLIWPLRKFLLKYKSPHASPPMLTKTGNLNLLPASLSSCTSFANLDLTAYTARRRQVLPHGPNTFATFNCDMMRTWFGGIFGSSTYPSSPTTPVFYMLFIRHSQSSQSQQQRYCCHVVVGTSWYISLHQVHHEHMNTELMKKAHR